MDDALLKILACPVCKAKVKQIDKGIICEKCSRIYPVKNNIPIMLAEEAHIDEKENK